jgi:CubicO group peptidase (beta-lactamase class C family)
VNHSILRLAAFGFLLSPFLSIGADKESFEGARFEIPKLEGVVIDGNGSEWAGAFEVKALRFDQAPPSAEDLMYRLRLGWDEKGLLLLADIKDDDPFESENKDELWSHDSLEIFESLTPSAGVCQVIMSPGMDKAFPQPRYKYYQYKGGKSVTPDMGFEMKTVRAPGGYRVEARLPWSNLKTKPEMGAELGFQFYVNDMDHNRPRRIGRWYKLNETHANPTRMNVLKLAAQTGLAYDNDAWFWTDDKGVLHASVIEPAQAAGKSLVLRNQGLAWAKGFLKDHGWTSYADLSAPVPMKGDPETWRVWIDNKDAAKADGEGMKVAQARAREEKALAAYKIPADKAIRAMLKTRVDCLKPGIGIVVGVLDKNGTRIVGYGKPNTGSAKSVDGDTVFEIGSITKVFTSTLLADMVGKSWAGLDDPVAGYLPAPAKMSARNGKEITLQDLATHRSGLPRMPGNFAPGDAGKSYRDYTARNLYDFLSGYKLPRDIGEQYEYSNLGVALLGHALALKEGKAWEDLVLERICKPLGLDHTRVTLSPDMRANLATGHGFFGDPAANWDLGLFAGAGGLRSTAKDLLKFAAAQMGMPKTVLLPAMLMTQKPRKSAGFDDVEIGLGWFVSKKHGGVLVNHSGTTGGYYSFLGFDPKYKRAVVVLTNTVRGIDDMGTHLLNPAYPVGRYDRKAIVLSPEKLDRFAGLYQVNPDMVLSVRREGGQLAGGFKGQLVYRMSSESGTEFFMKDMDVQATFKEGKDGKVEGLVLHANGQDQPATRISGEAAKAPVAVKVDPAILDAYAGEYYARRAGVFTVKREGDSLKVRLAGQDSLEVVPESQTEFFYKDVDARITFYTGFFGGRGMVLHQNGDLKAKKVK